MLRTSALLLALLLPLAAQADEARCAAIDADPNGTCFCSEPLNTNSYSVSGNKRNPTDTNSHECGTSPGYGGAYSVIWDDTWDAPVAEFGMPTGNTVDYVWQTTGPGFEGTSTSAVETGFDFPASAVRWCMRTYFRLGPSFNADSGGGAGCGTKLMDMFGGTYIFGGAITATGTFFDSRVDGHAGGPDIAPEVGTNQWSDCQDSWCRMEGCISGDLDAGTGFTYYLEIVRLSTGATLSWGPDNFGDVTGTWPVQTHRPVNFYRQYVNSGGSCDGKMYASHIMEAYWTTDTGQVIGAAQEVEGGGGSIPSGGYASPGVIPGVID